MSKNRAIGADGQDHCSLDGRRSHKPEDQFIALQVANYSRVAAPGISFVNDTGVVARRYRLARPMRSCANAMAE